MPAGTCHTSLLQRRKTPHITWTSIPPSLTHTEEEHDGGSPKNCGLAPAASYHQPDVYLLPVQDVSSSSLVENDLNIEKKAQTMEKTSPSKLLFLLDKNALSVGQY